METVLANFALEHEPLAALIGNRAHWDRLPSGVPDPSIVMRLVSGVRTYTFQGPSKLVSSRVQFDCRAGSKAAATAIATALEARLSGFRGTYDGIKFGAIFHQGERSLPHVDGATSLFIRAVDYRLWWKPTA